MTKDEDSITESIVVGSIIDATEISFDMVSLMEADTEEASQPVKSLKLNCRFWRVDKLAVMKDFNFLFDISSYLEESGWNTDKLYPAVLELASETMVKYSTILKVPWGKDDLLKATSLLLYYVDKVGDTVIVNSPDALNFHLRASKPFDELKLRVCPTEHFANYEVKRKKCPK